MSTGAAWEIAERVDLSEHIRSLTDEEVEAYRENGWIEAKGFITGELCAQIVEHYKAWSGVRWDEWPSDPAEQEEFMAAVAEVTKPGAIFAARQDDPWLFNYVTQPKLGEAAARLMGVPAIRPFSESLQLKYPKSSGRSYEIGWHQDWPYMPIDRIDAVQLWVALRPVTEDMGCMVHLTGSHREPPMGMLGYAGEDARDKFPWLWEKYEQSKPHAMEPGDVMFHHGLTWHYSYPNETDRIRWAMSNQRIAADCLYTGQQNYNSDGLGLVPNKTFDHPNYPIVYDARAAA
jgi:ectoine hydroxylase-related dioxygenase (phytanoyl-CoA dioxygenase family)